MKRNFLTGALASLVIFGSAAQDMAVATVRLEKTEPISGHQLDKTIQVIEQQQSRALTTEEKKVVLDQLIDQVILLQAAASDKKVNVSDAEVEQAGMALLSQQLIVLGYIPPGAVLTDKEQYRQVVEEQGISLEEYEETVRDQLLVEKYISLNNEETLKSIPAPTEESLSNEYQRRLSEFLIKDSVWFNHIFFDTSESDPEGSRAKNEKAKNTYNRLINSSATFEELVISESEDEVSKFRGGIIGPVMAGDEIADQLYGSEFIANIFSLKVGEISKVLKSNLGYHIVQIAEKKPAQLLPENDSEVRSYLEKVVYAAQYQEVFERVAQVTIAELRKRATINYFGDYK
ncbi:hypothetical protein S1OALGB6SA_1604 [Olavius algarvensis spirochete endosymbiont]|uniref:peptidylprolyl isomerase n=1 Tax=Olavius algarvensis spirochete endosymbiont TaxID=260710 RepID=UPI000F0E2406|nr:peptidyl-prolyl cis-trans isomerase [Olavius algarvensis spirochete endosymbiont]VDB00522.1 hypothetical protein S1OALGB6SA_1604 [Olavius algarvensis spirochete endosymbiont]